MDEQGLRNLQNEYSKTLSKLRDRRMEIQAGLQKSKQYAVDMKRIEYLQKEEAEITVVLADIARSLAGCIRF